MLQQLSTNASRGITRLRTAVRTRLGAGRPRTQEAWEHDYNNGRWDRLRDLEEFGRYCVIRGYTLHHHTQPRVLDIGAGEGVMLDHLKPETISSYVGVDISQVAIDRANERFSTLDDVRFDVADAEAGMDVGEFDVIVLNEVLYYFDDPLSVMRSLRAHLAPGGVFVVSMVHDAYHSMIWRRLKGPFEEEDKTVTQNRRGIQWTVALMR